MPAFAPDSFTTFGDLLKYLRRREQLTQLELSIKVGYSEAQIGRLEKNQRRPDLSALKALFIPSLHLQDEPTLVERFLELAQLARQEDAPAAGVAPYKGLLFFDVADADLFFGREALTAQLVKRVTALSQENRGRFLTVVGASGSGKSSLIRAGLAVSLKQAGWTTEVFTPTATPDQKLEEVLNPVQPIKDRPTLFIVDQFEETFTLCHDENERLTFIDQLLKLADQAQPAQPTVLITLRADFYSHCAQYPALRQMVAAHQEYIGQMTALELRRAIEEPAKRGGWEFEPGLVDRLLLDIGAQGSGEPEPGALPLLSHALLATWERRRGHTFTLAGYQASGGVRSAIAETAESVFTDQLNQKQQALARDVFLRLTELGEGTEDTRRRAALNELVRQAAEAAELRAVLNTLAEARLITLNEDSAEVAHEALIREWQRLHDWLTQDREGLRLHRHLTEAAHDWESFGQDAGALYRGAPLVQAREWALTHAEQLNDSERDFLNASIQQEQNEVMEREAQRQRELETAQKLAETQARRAEEQARSAKQLRRRALFLAGAFGLAIVLAGFALFFGQQATVNARNAQAEQQASFERELAAAANSNLSVDPERSVLLALQAVAISKQQGQPVLVEAADALHRSIESSRILATLRGHTGGVWSLAVNGAGTRLATISQDGTAKVWDLKTRQAILTLPTHITDNLTGTGLVFTPDDAQLLTVSDHNTASLWDASTGQKIFILIGHTATITSVAVSPNGQWFATASDDTTVKIWEAATGHLVKTLTGHEGSALVLAFSTDGSRLFAGSDGDGYVIGWDIASGRELFRFSGQGPVVGVDAIAVSPDGSRLATGEFDTTVRIWEAGTGKLLLTLFGHSSQVVGLAFSPDGETLASVSEDGTARLWEVATGRELLTLTGHTGGVLGVAFSRDGNQLYTTSRDHTLKIWDVSATAGSDWLNLAGHTDRIQFVGYSPDGSQLATSSSDGTAKVWDLKTGQVLLTLPHANSRCTASIGYSPDGSRLAVAGNPEPKVFDAHTGSLLLTLPPFSESSCALMFSPDGTRLAAGSDSGLIRIFESASGKQLIEFTATTIGLEQIVFSPDGQRLATADDDGAVVWDAKTGQRLVTFTNHGLGVRVSGIAFSPDGKLLATAGNDANVRVWDSQTGAERYVLTGHTGAIFSVAFSPDGKSLASSSVDRTIKIWSLPENGGSVPPPLTLYGHTAAVYRLAFSPDGNYLASVGRDQVARIYALNIDSLIAIAKTRLTRSLTIEECQKFLHMADCPVEGA